MSLQSFDRENRIENNIRINNNKKIDYNYGFQFNTMASSFRVLHLFGGASYASFVGTELEGEQDLYFINVMEEEIIGSVAGINVVVLLVQHIKSKKTRIFIREPTTTSKLSKIYNTHEIDGIEWREVLDLDRILLNGEWIISCSCSWETIAFVTSFGRILTLGQNHKGELGRSSSENAGECEIVSTISRTKPFFVKTCSGEYDLLALSKDGKVYRCGFTLGIHGILEKLTEFDSKILSKNEYYQDIACTAKRAFASTNKKRIFCLNNCLEIKIPHSPIQSVKLHGFQFLRVLVNNSKGYMLKNDLLVQEYEAKSTRLEELMFCGNSYYSLYYWHIPKESYYCRIFKHNLLNSTMNERLTDITIYFL